MLAPTVKSLARRLEKIIEANHDVAMTIPEEDFDTPIVELEIGSLDLIEWAFDLEAEFSLEFGDADLAEVSASSFSLEDAARWLADVVPAGV